MIIKIGSNTKKYMNILEISEYPFSETDLKSNFRKLIKIYHTDNKNGNKKKAQMLIEAYHELKHIALSDLKDSEIKTNKEMIEKEIENDMFAFFSDCTECNGSGEIIYDEPDIIKCKICHGLGFTNFFEKRCYSCKGKGHFLGYSQIKKTKKCLNCYGTGRIKHDPFNPVIVKRGIL